MDTPKTLPPKSIQIKLFDNEYTVKFPTNGQLIDIESNKIILSKDTHKSMVFAATSGSDLAYVTIEAISTFLVMVPKLKEDLAVKNLLDLTPIETKPLIKQYTNVYYPWFKQWIDVINEDDKVEVK